MENLQIAVCDDQEYELSHIRNMLAHITEELGCQANITVYSDSKSILANIEENPQCFDMLFLDMYIDEKIGFDIAEAVRKHDHLCAIVFITAFADRMAESFRYITSAYLVKPVDELKLKEAFQTALAHLNAVPSFCFCRKEKEFAIPFHKIIYLESKLKDLYLFCDQEKEPVVFQEKLMNVINNFPKDFFHLCHKSFLVNFSYVHMIDRKSHEIVISTGEKLKISRTYYPQILKDFTEFHSIRRAGPYA